MFLECNKLCMKSWVEISMMILMRLIFIKWFYSASQQTFTCSKATRETLEKVCNTLALKTPEQRQWLKFVMLWLDRDFNWSSKEKSAFTFPSLWHHAQPEIFKIKCSFLNEWGKCLATAAKDRNSHPGGVLWKKVFLKIS